MRANRLLAASAAVPLCAVTAYMAVVVLGEASGRTVLAARPPANLAEAAASGRADLVFRMMRAGDRATAVYDVHPDVISSEVRRATALEAAIWSRQLELIELFERAGAIPDDARRDLACLAVDLGVDDLAEHLAPAEPACVDGQAKQAVVARTRAGSGQ
jgi:hypothetical protein